MKIHYSTDFVLVTLLTWLSMSHNTNLFLEQAMVKKVKKIAGYNYILLKTTLDNFLK